MKVFGHSGVGKTTLIESLRAGYFSGLFRRSKSKTSTVIGSANGKFVFGPITLIAFLLLHSIYSLIFFYFYFFFNFLLLILLEKGAMESYNSDVILIYRTSCKSVYFEKLLKLIKSKN